ncbi:MAG: ornithine carbamoyltransferase, partial [Chitinispirillaceae bacterium]|nr:ornithine carbamoyltransferase [Chitinispirillaceae bacterium]
VWTSMGQERESDQRRRDFAAFQVNEKLMSYAPAGALVSHCLPAHRGEEITSGVLDSKRSVAFDEAENRLHVQKAVIVHLFSRAKG